MMNYRLTLVVLKQYDDDDLDERVIEIQGATVLSKKLLAATLRAAADELEEG